MELLELQTAALGWLDDPDGSRYAGEGDFSFLRELINTAYEEEVRAIDAAPGVWNLAAAPDEIAVTSAAREYAITARARRPYQACRVTNGVSTPLDEVPWASRNDSVARTRSVLPRFSAAPREKVYFYRRSSGLFYLGFCDEVPTAQTVQVFYAPIIERLVGAKDIPLQVPSEWHALIGLGAAVLGKIARNRDAANLIALRETRRVEMLADLDRGITGAKRSWRPIG
jgi:hypothetical protein